MNNEEKTRQKVVAIAKSLLDFTEEEYLSVENNVINIKNNDYEIVIITVFSDGELNININKTTFASSTEEKTNVSMNSIYSAVNFIKTHL